jgi:hypothetical protein
MGRTDTGSDLPPDAVFAELNLLRRRVDHLEQRLTVLEGGAAAGRIETAVPVESPVLLGSDDGFSDWLNRGAILQKMAAVCFILVFALLLRTITDYGYVNPGVGTLLGLGYVAVLVGSGSWLYRQQRPLAPVFAGCGFLLLFAIVVESLNRFATLSTTAALLILVAALAAGSFMGLRFTASRLLAVCVVGVAVSGLAGGFPKVLFPAAGGLLLAANLVALLADRRGVSRSLKWWVTLLTLCFWALWGFKVYMALRHGQPLAPLYIGWYLPLLLLFGGMYLAIATEKYFRSAQCSAYEAILPSLAMLLLFLAGRVVVVKVWEAATLFGGLAVGLAGLQVLIGWRLSVRDVGRCAAIGGSMVAGALLLALGLPELLGGLVWAIPGWALAAYGLARLSGRCDSAVLRVISYLYQLFVFWVGLMSGVLTSPPEGQLTASLLAASALAVCSLAQYRWCRQHPPPAGSLLARLDERDHSAVILLLCGLGGLYFLGALLLDTVAGATLAEPGNTMRCGRSLLINFGVLVLLLLGSRQRLPELLWVAVALAVVGCLKVFFFDLFKSSGLPLVLSVLSFGVVAALGSILMGRRQKPGPGNVR